MRKKAQHDPAQVRLAAEIKEAEALIDRAVELSCALDDVESEMDDVQMDLQDLNNRLRSTTESVQASIYAKKTRAKMKRKRR